MLLGLKRSLASENCVIRQSEWILWGIVHNRNGNVFRTKVYDHVQSAWQRGVMENCVIILIVLREFRGVIDRFVTCILIAISR